MASNSEILDRLPPQNLDAEKGVLGSMLLASEVIDDVMALIDWEDFYARSNQALFRHLSAMHNEGLCVDATLLVERLKNQGELELIGGVAYLHEVAESVPTAANAVNYAYIVRNKALLRTVISQCTETLREAYDSDLDPPTIVRQAESRFSSVLDAGPPAICSTLVSPSIEP